MGMDDLIQDHAMGEELEHLADVNCLPGIIAALGELKPGAIITEEGAAHLFKRHVASVKRAVQRGELPPPCRLFGTRVWTVGALVRHIEQRLKHAAQDAERTTKRIETLSSPLFSRGKAR